MLGNSGSLNASVYTPLNGGSGGGGGGGNGGSVRILTSNLPTSNLVLYQELVVEVELATLLVPQVQRGFCLSRMYSPSDSTVATSSTGSIVLETINIFPSESVIATSSDFVSLAQDYKLLASDSTLSTTSAWEYTVALIRTC